MGPRSLNLLLCSLGAGQFFKTPVQMAASASLAAITRLPCSKRSLLAWPPLFLLRMAAGPWRPRPPSVATQRRPLLCARVCSNRRLLSLTRVNPLPFPSPLQRAPPARRPFNPPLHIKVSSSCPVRSTAPRGAGGYVSNACGLVGSTASPEALRSLVCDAAPLGSIRIRAGAAWAPGPFPARWPGSTWTHRPHISRPR